MGFLDQFDFNDSKDVVRTIRKVAILTATLGILFSILFTVSQWYLYTAPRPKDSDEVVTDFYSSDSRRVITVVGLYLLPLAAVAFIWFISAVRQWVAHSPRRGSQLLGTVQLLSGMAFITLTLAAAAANTLPAILVDLSDEPFDIQMAREFPLLGNALLFVFGIRMAAIFIMTTTTIARAGGLMPNWFAVTGYLASVLLFLSYTTSLYITFVFPLWILAFSLLLLHSTKHPERVQQLWDQRQAEFPG